MAATSDDSVLRSGAPRPVLFAGAIVLAYVATLVVSHGIDAAVARGLLPRWDLAAHLANGWTDYYYLTTGALHRLAWDLWSQGYWPPGQSLFQVPFYLAFGGSLTGGLLSSVAAFLLTGVASLALLGAIWGRAAWLPASIALVFLVTSPFFLGYAAVSMSEMVGAMAQAWVLLCHARFERTRHAREARWFAVSLTVLFFTKYNYFVLLALPLGVHIWLTETSALTIRARWDAVRRTLRRIVTTPEGALVTAVLVVAALIELTDGFVLSVGTRRIAFRTIGYLAHPVLYFVIARVWWRHRQGRIDWRRLSAGDPRIAALLTWFVVPVAVWLASPLPNHIKDVANLLVNVPMGPVTAQLGLAAYFDSLRHEYFLHPWLAAAALGGFVSAAIRYRAQPPLVRLLMTVAVLQFGLVTAHQTRDPRFLLLAMPPFWLVSAGELGGWLSRRQPRPAAAVALVVAAGAVAGARGAVEGPAFRRIAFANYVDSPALSAAFAAVRDATGPDDRVAVLGRHDAVSPGLVRWQLGPASGEASFPIEIYREADVDQLREVAFILAVAPAVAPPDTAAAVGAPREAGWLAALEAEGRIRQVREYGIPDLGTSVRLYVRNGAF